LFADVEGTCTGQYYIIAVIDTVEIGEGKIIPGSGSAQYTVTFSAVVWRPFKGEVVDGIVGGVNKLGFFASVGPFKVFVSAAGIPSDIRFDENATPPQWTDNVEQVIERGVHVRVKISGVKSSVGHMDAIGSIKEDFLGTL